VRVPRWALTGALHAGPSADPPRLEKAIQLVGVIHSFPTSLRRNTNRTLFGCDCQQLHARLLLLCLQVGGDREILYSGSVPELMIGIHLEHIITRGFASGKPGHQSARTVG